MNVSRWHLWCRRLMHFFVPPVARTPSACPSPVITGLGTGASCPLSARVRGFSTRRYQIVIWHYVEHVAAGHRLAAAVEHDPSVVGCAGRVALVRLRRSPGSLGPVQPAPDTLNVMSSERVPQPSRARNRGRNRASNAGGGSQRRASGGRPSKSPQARAARIARRLSGRASHHLSRRPARGGPQGRHGGSHP